MNSGLFNKTRRESYMFELEFEFEFKLDFELYFELEKEKLSSIYRLVGRALRDEPKNGRRLLKS